MKKRNKANTVDSGKIKVSRKASNHPKGLALLALEPRIMLDAAIAATADAAYSNIHDSNHEVSGITPSEAFIQALSELQAPSTSQFEQAIAATITEDGPNSAAARNEVVFIDVAVNGYEQLQSAAQQRGLDVYLINGDSDGLKQIADYLQSRTNIDAIHILGHGETDKQFIGSTALTAESLSVNAELLSSIGKSLTIDGDIMLYGCRVAALDGSVFLDQIATLTGADIAASDDLTANPAQGGDWDLEIQSGPIEAKLPFEAQALSNFTGSLNTVSLTGKDNWVPVMSGSSFDPQGDSQAGGSDLDVVGGDGIGVLYAGFR